MLKSVRVFTFLQFFRKRKERRMTYMEAITLFTSCLRIAWFRDHFVSSISVIFIWGLILSHSLMEYTVMCLLINYIGNKKHLSLWKAAIVVNLVNGGSLGFVIIVTHITEAYTGCFNMISICTAAYVMGLSLLWVVERFPSKFYLFFVALFLMALGSAVKDPPLRSFLEFQLREKVKQNTEAPNGDDEEEEQRIDISTEIWWKTAWISGAAIGTFILGNADWSNIFLVCGLVLGVSYLFFLIGFKYYHIEKPTGSPLTSIYRVFKAALLKLNLEYPDSAEKYFWKDERPNYLYSQKPGELKLLPRAPSLFRFLDKAAIIREASNLSPEWQEKKGELRAVKEVREVKCLIPVINFGLTFLAYSLVVASGDTYFVKQKTNLDPKIGSFEIPTSFLFVVKSFTRDVVIFCFWWFGLTQQRITTWRIGAGMFCAVLCCITAWQVELHRLFLIKRERVLLLKPDDQEDHILHMSILLLIPQYFLLGLMEGLTERGLEKFFYNTVPKSLRNLEQSFSEMVLSIGKFLSIPCVLIFGSWFKDTMNTSHLDKYFLMLAILSFVFFCIYLYFSSRYYSMEVYQVSEESDPMGQISEEIQDSAGGESGSIQVLRDIEEGIDTLQGLKTNTNQASKET